MFPNLRLMLSASLATIVLVAIVGSSLVLFRPPPASRIDVPEIVRPIVSIADDNRPVQLIDPGTRRNEELQRLLALPSSPVRAYAPEPPATFPYEVTTAPNPQAGGAIATAPAADPAPALAQPPAHVTATAEGPAAEPEVTEPEPPATVVATAPQPAPGPDPKPAPAAEDITAAVAVPVPAAEEPMTAAPAPIAEPPATVIAATKPSDPPAKMPEAVTPTPPAVAVQTDNAAQTADTPDAEMFPVSSIPAVEDAPLPRAKPQMALALPHNTADKAEPATKASPRPQQAKPKPRLRRNAGLARRIKRPLPAPTAFESQQGQFPFFGANGGGTDNGWQNGNSNWQSTGGDRRDPGSEQATATTQQHRTYGIRPPTTSVR